MIQTRDDYRRFLQRFDGQKAALAAARIQNHAASQAEDAAAVKAIQWTTTLKHIDDQLSGVATRLDADPDNAELTVEAQRWTDLRAEHLNARPPGATAS